MTGKIFRSCVLVGVAVMVLCMALFLAAMASRYEEEVYHQLEVTADYARQGLEAVGPDYLQGLESDQRVTWIDVDGTVLYDSVADESTMENHADRDEVIQAMEEGSGRSKHISNTLLQKTLYYAVEMDDGTVLRLSCQETTMGALVLSVLQPILWVLVLALILSGVLSSRLARQITRPINSIDLENPRLDETYEELFPLVGRLREQNRTISRQMEDLSRRQREFAALAENMSEGVLLLDSRYNILYGNQHVVPGCFGGELLRGGVEAPFPPYIQRGVAHNLDSRTIQALDCGQIAGEGGGHNHDKASSRTRAAGRADNLGPNKKAPHAAGLAYQMVEMKGVEPSASAMRRQRSPN